MTKTLQTDRYDISVEELVQGGPGGYEGKVLTHEGGPVDSELYDLIENMDGTLLPAVNRSLRQRNGENLVESLREGTNIGIASGFKPSGAYHFGHKLTTSTVSFFQKNGIQVFVPVADVECEMSTELSREEYSYWAADNLLDWGASGINLDVAHVYLQSEERKVNDLAYAVARGLDFKLAVDIYGFEKLCGDSNKSDDKGEFPFLFAGITQVGDILLPQHLDFGNIHSFMISGQDQDGHMKMTNELTRRMFTEDRNIFGIRTVPSAIYIPHVRGFKSSKPDEKPKMSSSWSPGTLYLGPGVNYETIEERVRNSIAKFDPSVLDETNVRTCALDLVRFIDSFNDRSIVDFAEATDLVAYRIFKERLEVAEGKDRALAQKELDEYLIDFCEQMGQDNVELVRESLGEVLREHMAKRQRVLDYAVARANVPPKQGWDEDFTPDPPEFWKVPERAIVDPVKRTKTPWFDIVDKAKGKLIA